MKLFLSFLIVAVAAVVYGFPSESNPEFNTFSVGLFKIQSKGLPINEDQIKCIREGTDKIVAANPDLKSWFDEVERTGEKLKEHALKCETYSGIRKHICLTKLKISALAAYDRLIKLLPSDRKEIVKEITTIVKSCLKS